MRVIIIEDEQNIIELLTHLLNNYYADIEITGIASTETQAIDLINNTEFDLALMDIKINNTTSFDILKNVNKSDLQIIFITAYKKFAFEAFSHNTVSYILKPIKSSELYSALDKFKNTLNLKNNSRPEKNKRLLINTTEKTYTIKLEDIVRLEASDCYTEIYTVNKQKIVASKVLKEFEKSLSEHPNFIRVHRSHIININFLENINKKDGYFLEMTDNSLIPISSDKKEDLLKLISL